MAKKSKLLMALDAEKGRNIKLEKQRKLEKQAAKRKQSKNGDQLANGDAEEQDDFDGLDDEESDEEEEDDEEIGDEEVAQSLLDQIDDSESESDDALDGGEEDQENDNEDDEGNESDIPLSDIESLASADKEDIIPHQRLTINNTAALTKALKSISYPSSLPFSHAISVTSSEPISIPDVNDDLGRELAIYKQCLNAAVEAREKLLAEGVPFSRPNDYFAEMVKTDEHMLKIKDKMREEAARKKAGAEARKQRDLKKFGKAVQVAKEQERAKEKRNTLDKINVLKRKRKDGNPTTTNEEDMFDVALDDEVSAKKRSRDGPQGRGGPGSAAKRARKDQKYGFGGKKRFSKSGDAKSSADMGGFNPRKMKEAGRFGGGKVKTGRVTKRLGKSRRK